MFIEYRNTLPPSLSLVATKTMAAVWATPDCSTADSPLQCRLLSWLSVLEAAAGVLTFLLIVTAVFAFVAFRRNKASKLEKGRSK